MLNAQPPLSGCPDNREIWYSNLLKLRNGTLRSLFTLLHLFEKGIPSTPVSIQLRFGFAASSCFMVQLVTPLGVILSVASFCDHHCKPFNKSDKDVINQAFFSNVFWIPSEMKHF